MNDFLSMGIGIVLLASVACTGDQGSPGISGPPGPPGSPGSSPNAGDAGVTGAPGVHGIAMTILGETFFPEGIALHQNTLYVGSVGTGAIVRKDLTQPGTSSSTFVPATTDGLATIGLLPDPSRNRLWACASPLGTTARAAIKAFDLTSGQSVAHIELPDGGSFCNDLALDAAGHLYATDPRIGRIVRLEAGSNEPRVWSNDPLYTAGAGPESFLLNGIAFDGNRAIYTVRSDTGQLFRIGINGDGTAAVPVEIVLPGNQRLEGPDGLKALNEETLLVVESTGPRLGRLSRLRVSQSTATKLVISTRLDEPTTAIARQGFGGVLEAFVVESQLEHFFDPTTGPASVPFLVKRVELPPL